MSVKGDEYRALAREQASASQSIIGKADPTDEGNKLQLALMSHTKATVYSVAADLFDELSLIRAASPMAERQELHQRLRQAAIRNDTVAMDKIVQELADKADESANP